MATGHPLLHQIEFNPKLVRRENRVGNNAVQHAEEFQEVGNDSDPQTWISPTLLRNLSRAGRGWRRMVGKRNEMALFQIELHPRIIVFKIIIIPTKIIYICVYVCIYIYCDTWWKISWLFFTKLVEENNIELIFRTMNRRSINYTS